jgi:hypothetical protein
MTKRGPNAVQGVKGLIVPKIVPKIVRDRTGLTKHCRQSHHRFHDAIECYVRTEKAREQVDGEKMIFIPTLKPLAQAATSKGPPRGGRR